MPFFTQELITESVSLNLSCLIGSNVALPVTAFTCVLGQVLVVSSSPQNYSSGHSVFYQSIYLELLQYKNKY